MRMHKIAWNRDTAPLTYSNSLRACYVHQYVVTHAVDVLRMCDTGYNTIMAATPASLCLGCGVITQSTDRGNLNNISSQHVVLVWKNIVAKERREEV